MVMKITIVSQDGWVKCPTASPLTLSVDFLAQPETLISRF